MTIKSVQLKKSTGEWVTVIEPDHQVDLVNQEPMVSFLNNGRRVSPGTYINFKIILSETVKVKGVDGTSKTLNFNAQDKDGEMQIYSREDLLQPLRIKEHSFIGVWFDLDLSRTLHFSGSDTSGAEPRPEKATVTVDGQTFTFSGESLRMTF